MKRLRTKIGEMYDMGPDNVGLCNGSSEIIDSMMRLFLSPGDEIIMSTPTFELFPPRAELCGGKVVQIPVLPDSLQYDVEGMLNAVNERTKLILIINPNNPTGVFIDDEDLIKFCELGIPLCIDEAYRDYHPGHTSKAPLIKKYPHVFLSATFSKAYGFAGVRFGFVLGTEEMVAAFNQMFLPWNVSLMSMAAAEAILDNPEELKEKWSTTTSGWIFSLTWLKKPASNRIRLTATTCSSTQPTPERIRPRSSRTPRSNTRSC
jgi:histidinol-phosphate aminotransferase